MRKRDVCRFGFYIPLLFLLASCQGGDTPGAGSEPTASVGITLSQAKSPQGKTKLSAVKIADITSLTVTARSETGNELARGTALVESGETVTLTLNVPVGVNRIFLAEAADNAGQVILFGEAVTDLQEGAPVKLSIPVEPPLQVGPENPTVDLGKKETFTSRRGSLMKDALAWFVDGISGGDDRVGTIAIAPTGDTAEYTAPAGLPEPGVVTVRVASAVDPTRYFDETTVTLNNPALTLFVDPETGIDSDTCGAKIAKCKTLTKALSLARPGGTVLLEPTGSYVFGSTTDDESLPLRMKPGVSIRGVSQTNRAFLDFTNTQTNGPGIIGADGAELSGMQIEIDQTFGPLIETNGASPAILDNLFFGGCDLASTSCNNRAILVEGGSPVISGNTFGSSDDPGGFAEAVQVGDDATPQILDNTFTGNQTALLIEGSAAPRLENNIIIQNGEGVIIQGTAQPDLGGGTVGSAGLNILSCNQTVDLFNNTFNPISAQNNQWDHEPPFTTTTDPVPGSGIDIAFTRTNGRVNTDNSALYLSAPCNVGLGITVSPISGLVTTEAGGDTASFSVRLNTQPSANVSIALSSSDTTEGTVVPASLTFTTSNWSTAQSVTVTGVNDDLVDGNIAYTIITGAATSTDTNYNGINPTDVSVTNNDNDHRLTVSVSGGGSGTVTSSPSGINCGTDCTEDYTFGTSVTLTAAPQNGSTFMGWSGHADCGDGSVTMDGNKTCTATFSLDTRVLTITKTGTGNGRVTSQPSGIDCGTDCQGDYDFESLVTLTAAPQTGSAFAGWSGHADCSDGSVTMDANKTCTATFNVIVRTLNVNKAGTGSGTVVDRSRGIGCGNDCVEVYADGATVDLTASPAQNSVFESWSGDCSGTNRAFTLVMNGDKSCTAHFRNTLLLRANFDADKLGQPPDLTLPGDPVGDRLTLNTASGTILVQGSDEGVPVRYVALNQSQGQGGLDLRAEVAGTPPKTGRYVVRWDSRVTSQRTVVFATLVIRDSSGNILMNISYRNGGVLDLNDENPRGIGILWSDVFQSFEVTVDMGSKTIERILIDGESPQVLFPVAFRESAASDLARFSFELGGTTGQGYAIDDIEIREAP